METLFDKELLSIDFDDTYDRFLKSTLDDYSVENELIIDVYDMQKEQFEILDTALLYLEEIIGNSTQTIGVDRKKITSSVSARVYATTIELDANGNNNSSGLMTGNYAVSSMNNFFWSKGSSVVLKNEITATSSKPYMTMIMMTFDIIDSVFLKKDRYQILTSCVTDMLGTSIRDSAIVDTRAINFYNFKEYYFLKTDVIDSISKKIINVDMIIDNKSIDVKTVNIPDSIAISEMYCDIGFMNLKTLTENFVPVDGYVDDRAELLPDVETNAKTVSFLHDDFTASKAPKSGWISVDLEKGSYVDESFIDEFVQMLLDGTPIDGLDLSTAIVSSVELDMILERVSDAILNLEVCVDS